MRKWLAFSVQVPLFAMMSVAACSGDDNNTPDASDGAVQDVKADKKILPDTGTPDVSSGQCAPETTIDSSQIKWVPPITPNPNACTDVQVQTLWDGCFDPNLASNTKCTGFLNATANATCSKCMISTYQKDTAYGALIQIGGVDYANISGCIAILSGDTSATGCGAKSQAVIDCETLACTNNCPPVTDQTTFKEWTTCTDAADNGICATYVNAQCDIADAGASACQQSGFQDYYFAYAKIFCGGNPAPDGGTTDGGIQDAAVDAPDGD